MKNTKLANIRNPVPLTSTEKSLAVRPAFPQSLLDHVIANYKQTHRRIAG